jgi:Tol biopolymer transport system component
VKLPAGTRLSTYEIADQIGAGGMGDVYRARDARLSRDVAIKVLPPAMASDAERLARFEKEARTASALSHPNVVTIYEIGKAGGTAFIAMELVEGKTLRAILESGPLPARKLLSLAAQAADGLAKAHAAGIVHRDLKPDNLMVTRDGFVKILDFGLAKLARPHFQRSEGEDRPTVSRLTEAGTVMGTVGYMSPEQASGEPLDFRSDQFSFGSILYEMITGRRAFERPTPAQTLSAIIEVEPEALMTLAPKTPMNLSWVVERCLAKDPEDRYGSTKDLARDLAALRDHPSWSSGTGVAPPAGRRLRVSRAALAGAALAVVGLGVLAYIAGQKAHARRDRETPLPRRTTLTFRRGYLTGARFAPDGQTIVYSAAWDGKPSEIFTARVGSNESRALGISEAGILAVSSTGEMAISLGCGSWRHRCEGTLARVSLAGGAPREILDDVVSADWSPDGRDLAVLRGAGSRLEYPIGKVLYETGGYLSSVRVSPRGDLVAFIDHPQLDSARGVLNVVDRSGKSRVLTKEWLRVSPILWSPSGNEVFFSRWGSGDIRGASLSGRIRSAPGVLGLDDVSRDGRFLDTGIMLENYRSVILARAPDEPEERNLSWLMSSTVAELSRDGKELLFYEEGADPERPDREVLTTFLRPTDGSDARALGEGRALALSPDKEWALVARPAPEPHLALLPTGLGEPQRLPGGGIKWYRRATFFPDGKRILFVAHEKDGGIASFIQDLEGGLPKLVEGAQWSMFASPDGREIVGGTESSPMIYPAEGEGRPREVKGIKEGDLPLQWSSDGKALFVRGTENYPMTLYRLDLATGRRGRWRELAPRDRTGFLFFGPPMVATGVSVTPDGKSYAYTYVTDSNKLVLIDGGPDWWK